MGDELRRIRNRGVTIDRSVRDLVGTIVDDVAHRGDAALFEYTERYDGLTLNAATVEVSENEKQQALATVTAEAREILALAARRIEQFHEKQVIHSWLDTAEDDVELGQLIRPLGRVGVYAPGGRAVYPSTVLMAAIPARVAGVSETIVVSPSRDGTVNPMIIAAAELAGVDRIYKIGGAQAIAALAYGTDSIPSVDKIVGPGNIYVATAKMMVYGRVGIDMMAGPSEILVVCDGSAPAAVVAADLLSQAEHDEMACAILLTPSASFADEVVSEVRAQLGMLTRRSIAEKAIRDFGTVIVTRDVEEAIEIANTYAPEHLELIVKSPHNLLDKISNAGAVFLGPYTPEAVGDYMAGPNHILPTSGTARFFSPLGVYDFIKRTSVVSFSQAALQRYGDKIAGFAEMEGFEAHARSIIVRLSEKKP